MQWVKIMTKDIKPEGESTSYNVVFQTRAGISSGVITRSSFVSRGDFEQWYGQNMDDGTNRPLREVYGVIAKGISNSDAERIIASPENTEAILGSHMRKQITILSKVNQPSPG